MKRVPIIGIVFAAILAFAVFTISAHTPAAAPVDKSAVTKAETAKTVNVVNITAEHLTVAFRHEVAFSPPNRSVSQAKALTGDIYETAEVNAYTVNQRGRLYSPPSNDKRTS